MRGSSPLTRGKHDKVDGLRHHRRLTPAHAGKTSDRRHCRPGRPAHPRSRGENSVWDKMVERVSGSSPLTRGKLVRSAGTSRADRLIPAHAGKTLSTMRGRSFTQAHPRSRGENQKVHVAGGGGVGSSPLTRGKREAVVSTSLTRRLIPAHAGKTATGQATFRRLAAHPRSRGENLLIMACRGS